MTGYQLGGLMIMVLGIVLLTASAPVVRLLPRGNHLAAQLGSGIVTWLTRIFAIIMCMLGVVTFLQQ